MGFTTTASKRLILAAAFVGLFGASAAPTFADMETLLDKLHEKGVLSDDDYQQMRTEARSERRAEALKEANESEKAAKKADSAPSELTGKFKDGFSWESGDKENAIAVTGRVHADYRQFNVNSIGGTPPAANAQSASTFDVRRAYIGLQGRIAEDWTFDLTADVAQTSAPQLDVAWVNWGAYKSVQFRAGQFKMPMQIEELTSSRFIDFTERSFVNQLAPTKERGAMIHGSPWTGVFYGVAASNGNGKNNNETSSTADGKDVIGRLGVNVAEIINNKDMVLHFAGSYSSGRQAAGVAPSERTEGRGITFFTPAAFATTYDRKRKAAEASLAWNQFKLQGEWLSANFTTVSGAPIDRDIDAYYAETMWLITGEKYADAYRGGAYGAIKPNRPYKKGTGGWGAWELGLRYSKFDAGDFPTIVGQTNKADAVTVGLKWIPTTNTRVYLNYVRTSFDQPVNVVGGTTDKENAINVRLGLYF